VNEIVSESPEKTVELGRQIAEEIKPGDILGFIGELGSGKTFIIKAICKALGVEEEVTSPTFTLMHLYNAEYKILHLDCYRLRTAEEAERLGLDDYFETDHVCLIEWADRIREILPEGTKIIEMDHVPDKPESRKIIM